ncbi:MAG TPA: Ig-like domain-containing protein [Bryobacteraceae bacterium]|nr:Ig-like domain-containing protein [Bryobacteraceae bacterium]
MIVSAVVHSAMALMFFAGSPAIKLDGGRVVLSGVDVTASEPDAGWQSVFPVTAGEGDLPPMLGSYSISDGSLIFKPRFGFPSGIDVRAEYKPMKLVQVFKVARSAALPKTKVVAVHPTGDTIPENQLKFYLIFSSSMSRGEVWDRIKLLKEDGSPVDLPFLEIEQELWDPGNKRLTILFDPGRIKRGVRPLAEAGPAIEEGKQYTLVISEQWRDADGLPLTSAFRKTFRVTAADRTPPDPAAWTVTAPEAGTRDPLLVRFPEPLDYAMLHRAISVANVGGSISVDDEDRQWQFTPDAPWSAGNHRLVIDTALEDLAGNKIGRPFDVDVFERVTRRIETRTVELRFRIGQ